jgi:hypothetical protein
MATTLSSSGMTLNSSNQTINFKQGFIMDNDIISVPDISVSIYIPGSSG